MTAICQRRTRCLNCSCLLTSYVWQYIMTQRLVWLSNKLTPFTHYRGDQWSLHTAVTHTEFLISQKLVHGKHEKGRHRAFIQSIILPSVGLFTILNIHLSLTNRPFCHIHSSAPPLNRWEILIMHYL